MCYFVTQPELTETDANDVAKWRLQTAEEETLQREGAFRGQLMVSDQVTGTLGASVSQVNSAGEWLHDLTYWTLTIDTLTQYLEGGCALSERW